MIKEKAFYQNELGSVFHITEICPLEHIAAYAVRYADYALAPKDDRLHSLGFGIYHLTYIQVDSLKEIGKGMFESEWVRLVSDLLVGIRPQEAAFVINYKNSPDKSLMLRAAQEAWRRK